MKKILILGGILIAAWYVLRPIPLPQAPKPAAQPKNMKLTSAAFANEEKIPREFSCDGKGGHPPLSISGVPGNAKSLAIIVDDPDAPAETFTHWVVWNIDPATTEIPAGKIPPKAAEGTNSAGSIGWTPPCPPNGTHRYFFTVFALDTTVGLDGKAKKADLEAAMRGRILEQTNLIGSYAR